MLKEQYTKAQLKEIEELCREAFQAGVEYSDTQTTYWEFSKGNLDDIVDENKWIEKNLKTNHNV